MGEVPSNLVEGWACGGCYEEKVEPEIQNYNSEERRARQMSFFNKNQSKESRLFKRIATPIQVRDCADRDEALLKLAYAAVKLNYNLIVDVELTSEKVRNAGYQTCLWHAKGIPTNA